MAAILAAMLMVDDLLPAEVRDYRAGTAKATSTGAKLNLSVVAVGGTAAVTADVMTAALAAAASAEALAAQIGNGWNMVFDVATDWKDDPKAAVDIDVNVNSKDKSVWVRFNTGKAKYADLKTALEERSAFDAMFEVKLPTDSTGGCGATANKLLALSNDDRQETTSTGRRPRPTGSAQTETDPGASAPGSFASPPEVPVLGSGPPPTLPPGAHRPGHPREARPSPAPSCAHRSGRRCRVR